MGITYLHHNVAVAINRYTNVQTGSISNDRLMVSLTCRGQVGYDNVGYLIETVELISFAEVSSSEALCCCCFIGTVNKNT